MFIKLNILVAPLDWGLGHSTRCIPIIDNLQSLGHQVFVAAEGASAKLLIENCPKAILIPLKGYRITYSKNKKRFFTKIIVQIPKILKSIYNEHKWLAQQQNKYHFDLVVSDNRYGLFHKRTPSIILTHQLNIQSNKGRFVDAIIRKLHYKALNKFQECWIVDNQEDGISGKLAHPKYIPKNAKYVGIISQFGKFPLQFLAKEQQEYILVLLSGPEPMRSILEKNIINQIQNLENYQFIVIGGNPLGNQKEIKSGKIKYYNYLAAEELIKHIQNAQLVISRSGYSTIMDLIILNKKALLIPTPGQTEQTYLAQYLHDKKSFFCVEEEILNLFEVIPKALKLANLDRCKTEVHLSLKLAISEIIEKIQVQNFL